VYSRNISLDVSTSLEGTFNSETSIRDICLLSLNWSKIQEMHKQYDDIIIFRRQISFPPYFGITFWHDLSTRNAF